ncbi:hypothetical protein GGI25_005343 [Coemansia spiralis]|uniref:RNA polymerase II elongation factor ELL N-terminal domain-containing protein n=2 Tax=Coemansia TaxID=4863 RepID=A0A9W8G325_9FUNG|nr:hypothetical protein EDC05_005064 [Coemansia umbellata]KAJ2619703.1 hypothetical protein GGI26_005604 [Coemansia sp. RSA 1358]KAJ2671844.1 hypothetical protein GGI25_005343 [Coemansia spiralis]
MSAPPKTPLLFVKLPRQLVDKLQTASPEELQLIIGGKERITTGSLCIGSMRYDVRYSAERAGTPPLLFQGGAPQTAAASGNWAQWTQRGKLVGKLTVLNKSKHSNQSIAVPAGSAAPAISPSGRRLRDSNQTSTTHDLNSANSGFGSEAAYASLLPAVSVQTSPPPSLSGSRGAPQKRPGILRQNREMLHDRLLHLLALAPIKEAHILERFNGPENVIVDTLGALGQKAGEESWVLQPEKYKNVDIESWPKYSPSEREKVIENALNAFDFLGLPADDPIRMSVLQTRRRLKDGIGSGNENSAEVPSVIKPATGHETPVAASKAVTKGPTVPSISLPKETPTLKRKAVRSVIAPTLVRKVQMEASKTAKRMAVAGAHPNNASNPAGGGESAPSTQLSLGAGGSKDQPPRSVNRQTKPAPLSGVKARAGYMDDDTNLLIRSAFTENSTKSQAIRSAGDVPRQQLGSAPNTAPNTAVASSFGIEAQTRNPRSSFRASRAGADVHMNTSRRRSSAERKSTNGWQDEPEHHTSSDVEAELHRHSRRKNRSPVAAGNSVREESGHLHVPVKSRPLHLESITVMSSQRQYQKPPYTVSAETGAAVSRVQERLAQEMISAEKRIPGLNNNNNNNSNSNSNNNSSSNSARPFQGANDVLVRRPRGPSLSPVVDQRSASPSPAPKVERAETIEDLQHLEKLLISTYAEYSQLRLRIDGHCAEFAPLAGELAAAQAACETARRKLLDERKMSETEREEGEEVPGDNSVARELGLAVDPVSSKCTPDGARLYWAESSKGGEAWISDSPEGVVGHGTDKAGLPCRMRRLLPEEARVLRASEAVVEKYAELDGSDVQRWVRRYLRLQSHIEQMSQELNSSYARIHDELLAQYDELREELGDSDVDDMLAECGEMGTEGGNLADYASAARTLTLDMYRDDVAATATTDLHM